MFTLFTRDGNSYTLTSNEVYRLLQGQPYCTQWNYGRLIVDAPDFSIACPMGAGASLLANAGIRAQA